MRDGALPEDRKTLGFGSNHITKIKSSLWCVDEIEQTGLLELIKYIMAKAEKQQKYKH